MDCIAWWLFSMAYEFEFSAKNVPRTLACIHLLTDERCQNLSNNSKSTTFMLNGTENRMAHRRKKKKMLKEKKINYIHAWVVWVKILLLIYQITLKTPQKQRNLHFCHEKMKSQNTNWKTKKDKPWLCQLFYISILN